MKKILISSCFLGQPVRYDGQSKPLMHSVIDHWQSEGRLISICPEVAGGLPIPRPPAELNQSLQKVLTEDGIDVTPQFTRGAELALAVCNKHNIRYALLKESSPSCGSHKVYDGSFMNQKINGQGVTAKLLSENGISVYSEDTIDQLVSEIARQ